MTYAVATLGAFAAFESLGRTDRRIDSVEELAGLGQTQPTMAALIAVFMFSLAGIPLLAGFWGKFWVFGSALNVGDAGEGFAGPRLWFIALAVLGMLNAAVAAVYYLRIVAIMFFRPPLATLRPEGGQGARWMAALCAVLVLAMGVYAGPWMRMAQNAAIPPEFHSGRESSAGLAVQNLILGQKKPPPPQVCPVAGVVADLSKP
jgi:NADH-quinone oxidoreductase subunit N